MESIQIDQLKIQIKRAARRRRLSLRVQPNGQISVSTNRTMGIKEIKKFVQSQMDWIQKTQKQMNNIRDLNPRKNFATGERFPFLGEHYPLSIRQGSPQGLHYEKEGLVFLSPLAEGSWTEEVRARHYSNFCKTYLATGKKVLTERIEIWSEKMQLKPTALSFRRQKSVWGSCSAQNKISLNLKLITAPLWVIDYVVIHELAHIVHKNHSAAFWNLVARYTPHQDRARDWLHQNVFLADFLGYKSDIHPEV